MTDYTYNTGNPIGSTDVRDGVDNLKSLDVLLNSTDDTYQDRLGNTVPTAAGAITGAIKRLGPVVTAWTFTTGGTLNYPNEAALNPADKNYYGWTGEFPKVVAPGTDPTAPGSGYVPRTDAVLRSELADDDGGKLVGVKLNKSTAIIRTVYQVLAEYISVTQFGAACDFDFDTKTGTDDTTAINNCLADCAGYKVLLPGVSLISGDIVVPDYTVFVGSSKKCGLALPVAPVSYHVSMLKMAGYKSRCENMTLWYVAPVGIGLSNVDTDGVYGVDFTSTSSYCTAENIDVYGKVLTDIMGFGFGFHISGAFNNILHCDSDYCTLGLYGGGEGHKIHHGHHSNHYYEDNGNTAWSQSSPYWDGALFEGLVDSEVCYVTCDDNGQSGIYCGGNNSLSYGNLFQGNKTRRNWNRGIDTGVSGTVNTTSNAVMFNRFIGNESIDNREAQLWYYNNIGNISHGNRAYITSDYAARYAGNEGGKVGIVVTGESAADNYIDDLVRVDSTSAACLTLAGTNNKISLNAKGGSNRIYVASATVALDNDVDYYYASFTPSILIGSGVTASAATGKVIIRGKKARYEISMTLAGSSPTGNLVIGYLPGIAGRTIRESNVVVDFWTAWSSSLAGNGVIKGYLTSANPDQISLFRETSTWNFDLAAYVGSASTIKITVEVDVS